MQGLLVYDYNGTILAERWLADAIIDRCIRISEEHGLTLTAYCGERIVADTTNAHTDRLLFYREPPPESVGCMRTALLGSGSLRVHKLLFMEADDKIQVPEPSWRSTQNTHYNFSGCLTVYISEATA